jgi:hypothetical protein
MIPKGRSFKEIRNSHVYYLGDKFKTIEKALKLLGKKPYGESAIRKFGNKKLAWFPKIAVLKNKALETPTNKIEWINMVSSDGSEVQQLFEKKTFPDGDQIFDDLSVERAIFAKLTRDQMYTFLGVFYKLPERGINNTEVYQRNSLQLSIDEWKAAGEEKDTKSQQDQAVKTGKTVGQKRRTSVKNKRNPVAPVSNTLRRAKK